MKKTNMPVALKKAEAAVKQTLKEHYTDSGLVIYLKLTPVGDYKVEYSYFGGAKAEAHSSITLEQIEYKEWAYYNYFNLEEAYQGRRSSIRAKLKEKGCYTNDAAGMKSAIKIYEILALTEAESMTARQLLKSESLLEDLLASTAPLEAPEAQIISTLPSLKDDNGRISVTARRALAKLREAGLISSAGKSSGVRYFLEHIR